MANRTNRMNIWLNSTSLSRPLAMLGTVSAALVASTSAQAFDANSLPQGGAVTGGSATIATSGTTLTVNQSSNRAIIDWRNFDIGANAQANFNQPGVSSIAVNRVNGATDPSRIDGGLHANGQVWILNPNGVLFGKTARVDAAGVVATTANIDDKAFMAGSNRLQMTGGDTGEVVNEGHISVGEGGLAAFVAPSVRNSGVIRARVGRVALAAGDTYTLDLAGDRLVELGLGSGHAVVDQSGKVVNPGGIINITAKAAGQVVDSVINVSGVTSASSVRTAGGQIILGGDDINVASTAQTSADGTSGGQITAVANKTGNYAGSYSAQGTTGDGGQIETSGHTVTVASDAKITASSAHGKAGTWTLDPLDVTITSGADNGTATGSTVTTGTIETALAGGTNVLITTDQSGTDNGDLTLAASINATTAGNARLTLTGRHLSATGGSTVNIAGGALTLNVNAVNNTATPGGSWINDAIAMTGTVSGGSTINLGAGTYTIASGGANYVAVNKSNITLNGAGVGSTIIDARNASSYGVRVIGGTSGVTLSNFTLWGVTAAGGYGVKAEDTAGLNVNHVTSQGAWKAQFDFNGVRTASLDHLTANGAAIVPGVGGSHAGAAIAITDSQDLTLTNSSTQGGAYGGVGIYQSNKVSGYAYQAKNITIESTNSFAESNPVYMEDESATNNFGAVTVAGFGYAAHNNANAADTFTYFQNSAQGGIDMLDSVGAISTGSLEGWTGTAGNNTFTVGFSTASHAMSIQSAVNAASSGATINVGAGTFREQVVIAKNLTLNGDGTTIESPDVLAHSFTYGGVARKAVVSVEGVDDVSINDLTIDGRGQGIVGQAFLGLGLYNSGGTITDVNITRVRSGGEVGTLGGGQTIYGFGAFNDTGSHTVTLQNSAINDFEKDAAAFYGHGLTANISDNTITGAGPTTANAQNGIVMIGASGTVTGNDISGISYSPDTFWATNIYLDDAGTTTVSGNTVTGAGGPTGSSLGLYVRNSDADVNNNTFQDLEGGIEADTGTATLSVTDNTFTNNLLHFMGDAAQTSAAFADNDFDRSVVNANAGETIYGGLQNAIDSEAAGSTLNVGAGTYNESIVLNKANTTLHSVVKGGAIIDAGGAATGINVSTTSGNLGVLTVDGFTVNNWTSGGIIQSMPARLLASMRVTNNTVNGPGGAGATSHGNGIEVTGDGSVVSGNTVNSVHLNSPNWSGSNIIVANGSHILVENNVADGNDTGIAVTNWDNTAGMSDITIRNNQVSNVAEGISIQAFEGEYFGTPSGAISGVTITGNTISNNDTGLGVWDFSDATNAPSWATTFTDISGNTFTNNDVQVDSDFADANLAPLLAANTFDHAVANDAVGMGQIYSDLTTAINTEAAGSVLDLAGTFNLSSQLNITKSLTLKGQSQAGTEITSNSTGYGINVTADNVSLQNFTYHGPAAVGGATYGIKVTPDTGLAADRLLNFDIENVTIDRGYRTGLDLNGVVGATIKNVSVGNIVHGNGIALTDSADVTLTGVTTANNAWGGLALYQTNAFYDQQVNNISVDGTNSFGDVIPVYAEDQSASKNFGSIALAGFDYVVKSPNLSTDVYTWFQKTQQAAVNFATNASLSNNNVNVPTATVQGYAGSGVNGNNHFVVGIGANTTAMSVNVALDQSTTGGIIDVLSGTYAQDVSLITPRTVNFAGATLNSLAVAAGGTGSTLSGSVKAGSVTAIGDIVLGGDLTLDTSTANGTIALANVNGAHALTLKAGNSGVVLASGLGNTTRLGAVAITADAIFLGATNKAASFAFNGDVALSAASTVIDTTVSSTAAGNINFAGDIFGLTDGGQSLTLNAGPGTGAKSANGDIAMNNAGISTVRLGSMTVTGDDFSALTVNLKGDFTATLTGNQVFAADTLNAGGNVFSQVAGNATGHVVAGGNVNMNASGNVSGTISGQTVNLTAGQTVSGTISGQTVTLIGQTVNGQVTATTLNVNAQGGTITGTFTPGTVSNGLTVNGQVTGSNSGGNSGSNGGSSTLYLNGQQFVVENFPLPIGTRIGANGQLILPAGTVIGLLSPGGGPARVILVSDVRSLGQLLSEGYVAFVIDLNSKKKAPVELASN